MCSITGPAGSNWLTTVRAFCTQRPRVLRLAPHTIYFSRTWLAGTLVHEACHIAYAAEGLTALDEERACLARQLQMAEKIRVPERETARITSADGSHIEVPPRALYW